MEANQAGVKKTSSSKKCIVSLFINIRKLQWSVKLCFFNCYELETKKSEGKWQFYIFQSILEMLK